ncbi:ABC transporter ATP-binding protein [Halorussus litoreus]|uniref:ABC transporter ATP-binding protein n=1 Tax=Halorussus litoreus TaxID=1710536 RepID=UPI000E28475E|nr:ABC transporter ATP-binding protein [Halorussus litoreus]
MTGLRLKDVSKSFGEVTALRGVSLDVADGEFFTLVGPSGCGKTTTLRAIAGFESLDSGEVWFGEREMAGVAPEDRDVGVVFQNYALFAHMTVGENVAYGLRFRDTPGGQSKDARVAELLDLVDLAGFEDRDPDALSGGQRQRVALARALAPGPDVLLLDEPMSALDARLRKTLRKQVKRIQSELGITTVYVTHDQEEALAVSDRVAVMNDGGVEQVGRPEAVYRRPETRFVAEFLGENNVFAGEVAERGGGAGRTVRVGGQSFRVADFDAADAARGSHVTFCVRPEKLVAGGRENAVEAAVEAVEFLGESFRAHLDWEGRELVVRLSERPEDDRLRVGFAPEDAHVVSVGDRAREPEAVEEP